MLVSCWITPVFTATAAAIELLAVCPGCALVDQLPVDMAYAMNLLIWWVSKNEIIDDWMLAMLRGVLFGKSRMACANCELQVMALARFRSGDCEYRCFSIHKANKPSHTIQCIPYLLGQQNPTHINALVSHEVLVVYLTLTCFVIKEVVQQNSYHM
jgi:hypothetical protein